MQRLTARTLEQRYRRILNSDEPHQSITAAGSYIRLHYESAESFAVPTDDDNAVRNRYPQTRRIETVILDILRGGLSTNVQIANDPISRRQISRIPGVISL